MATPRLDKIVIGPDMPPEMVDAPLAPIELEATAHWTRFCADLVASLNRQGPTALDNAIRAAWWRMEYLTALTMAQNPGLHRTQAEELHRSEFWLLPESSETPDTLPPIIS